MLRKAHTAGLDRHYTNFNYYYYYLDLFSSLFFFFIFLNNPISSSICKLPIRTEIYKCTLKNTTKVSNITIDMKMIFLFSCK